MRSESDKQRLGLFRLLVIRRFRVARRRNEISEKDYQTALSTLRSDDATEQVIAESSLQGGIDWNFIAQWIKENWLEILKVILTIAVLFLDKPQSPPYTSGGKDHAD